MILYDWINSDGVKRIIEIINTIIDIIHIVVPIGLIIMTTLDIVRKIINPDDKDGQKKIMHRLIAALIIFMIPLFINFVMKLVNIGIGEDNNSTNNTGNNSSSNNNTSNNSNTNNNQSTTPVYDNIKITNCPSSNKVYTVGDKIILNANLPNNYDGNVIWEMYTANEYVNLTPSTNTLELTIDVLKYYPAGNIIVIARGSKGQIGYEMCKINIRNSSSVTGDILINNCPKDKVKIGESFTINSNSDVNFYNYVDEKYYELTDNQNGTATIKVIGHYSDYLPVMVRAQSKDGKVGYCYFYTYKE